MIVPSYVSGTSSVPLLGETVGENLRRTVERFPDQELGLQKAAAIETA